MQTEAVKMSQVEYAAHRGVTKQAINKGVKAGRIPTLPDGKIDAAAADLALDGNVERVNADAPQPTTRAPTGDAGGLTRAKIVTEVYSARMAELKFGIATGKYVEAAGIADAAAVCGEAVVRIVRALHSKAETIHAGAIKDGVAGVRQLLKDVELEMLTRISNEFSKMGAAAVAGEAQEDAEPEQ